MTAAQLRSIAGYGLLGLLTVLLIGFGAVGGAAGSAPAAAPAADTAAISHVVIEDFAFTPQTRTIAPGTTVHWMNEGSAPHTTTSDDSPPVWDSGFMDSGDTFEHTFNSVGSFTYSCDFHPSMTGTIVVRNPVATRTRTRTPTRIRTKTRTRTRTRTRTKTPTRTRTRTATRPKTRTPTRTRTRTRTKTRTRTPTRPKSATRTRTPTVVM